MAIVAGSANNLQAKVLIAGNLLSVGTSFVNMVNTDGNTFDMNGYANAMYDGLGRPFIFGCRTNGAMVWNQLRSYYGMKKDDHEPAEKVLKKSPIANYMVNWQPGNESFPISGSYNMVRANTDNNGFQSDYPGLVETTLASMCLFSKGFADNSIDTLYITGGTRVTLLVV